MAMTCSLGEGCRPERRWKSPCAAAKSMSFIRAFAAPSRASCSLPFWFSLSALAASHSKRATAAASAAAWASEQALEGASDVLRGDTELTAIGSSRQAAKRPSNTFSSSFRAAPAASVKFLSETRLLNRAANCSSACVQPRSCSTARAKRPPSRGSSPAGSESSSAVKASRPLMGMGTIRAARGATGSANLSLMVSATSVSNCLSAATKRKPRTRRGIPSPLCLDMMRSASSRGREGPSSMAHCILLASQDSALRAQASGPSGLTTSLSCSMILPILSLWAVRARPRYQSANFSGNFFPRLKRRWTRTSGCFLLSTTSTNCRASATSCGRQSPGRCSCSPRRAASRPSSTSQRFAVAERLSGTTGIFSVTSTASKGLASNICPQLRSRNPLEHAMPPWERATTSPGWYCLVA
mmetsp:Transcript_53827/g.169352  ORF Transcript_53827/g.169352 Transcript_53827/m.169352 type:complete len:412 (-) Transcript_53827:536-1771(-)